MATKPKKKRKQAGAEEGETPTARGHKYELTAAGAKLEPDNLNGLRAELFKLLSKGPQSVDDVLASGKFASKAKDPKKVIASYLTVWKREGIVRFAKGS